MHYQADLFGCSLASSMPVPIRVNVSQSSSFIHRVEREEMNLSDTSSCLMIKFISNEKILIYFDVSVNK